MLIDGGMRVPAEPLCVECACTYRGVPLFQGRAVSAGLIERSLCMWLCMVLVVDLSGSIIVYRLARVVERDSGR